MTTRADLIKAGVLKPTSKVAVVANRAAIAARKRDCVTKTDKAMAILRAAMYRRSNGKA